MATSEGHPQSLSPSLWGLVSVGSFQSALITRAKTPHAGTQHWTCSTVFSTYICVRLRETSQAHRSSHTWPVAGEPHSHGSQRDTNDGSPEALDRCQQLTSTFLVGRWMDGHQGPGSSPTGAQGDSGMDGGTHRSVQSGTGTGKQQFPLVSPRHGGHQGPMTSPLAKCKSW